MPPLRIVMRPVDDRRTPRIVDHFAAHLDAVAGLHRHPRRDADVVHYLHRPRRGLDSESLMFASGARSKKIPGLAADQSIESDFGRRGCSVRRK